MPDIALEDPTIKPNVIASDDVASTDELPAAITPDQRHAAYHATHDWQGRALQPFAFQRYAMFHAARIFTPLGYTRVPSDAKEWGMERAMEAAIVLYLCDTDDAQLVAVMHNGQRIVEQASAWMDANVARDHIADAIALAAKIVTEEQLTLAVPKPGNSSKKAGGN